MSVIAYILMTVKKGGENNTAEKIRRLDGVKYVAELYGMYDLIAKVEKDSMEDLQKFLVEKIRTINEIDQTSTMIAVR
jgi:DNA-binding Lrp family transcriptional regulator